MALALVPGEEHWSNHMSPLPSLPLLTPHPAPGEEGGTGVAETRRGSSTNDLALAQAPRIARIVTPREREGGGVEEEGGRLPGLHGSTETRHFFLLQLHDSVGRTIKSIPSTDISFL